MFNIIEIFFLVDFDCSDGLFLNGFRSLSVKFVKFWLLIGVLREIIDQFTLLIDA